MKKVPQMIPDFQDHLPTLDSLTLNDLGTYMLFEDINPESIRDVCEFVIKSNYVYSSKDKITLMINSPGGAVYDGFALIDLMQLSKVPICTVAIGNVSSMGAVIFTAGTRGERVMTKNSCMMIHQFADSIEGKYHEIIAQRAHQDKIHERFVKHFVANSNLTTDKVKKLILNASDCYIEAKDALKMGLCDRIQSPWQ